MAYCTDCDPALTGKEKDSDLRCLQKDNSELLYRFAHAEMMLAEHVCTIVHQAITMSQNAAAAGKRKHGLDPCLRVSLTERRP